ncbi:MAG: hypothetical protein IPI67_10765 [Myxococcales bacterium]|nr:hypothetical protein [Myxococcales bacterium]
MKVLSLLGLAVFMLTSLVVGLRLLVLWSRTRKLPELLLALATLFVGFLCFAVGTGAKILIQGTPELRGLLTLIGLGIECLGHGAFVAFAWRVFRPKSRGTLGFAILLGSLIGLGFAGELYSGEYLRYSDSQLISGPFVPIGLATRGLAPAWLAFECLRFYRQLRLRLSIGLAEPLVVNRVLLWGIATCASAVAYGTSFVHRVVFGTGLREHLWAISTVSLLGTVSAVALALAFFPPQAYQRWVEADGGDSSA